MSTKPVLIHTHFHKKRTGVTRSIENVFPFFESNYRAFIFGYGVNGPKMSFGKLLKLVFSKSYFVLHCHRNNEIVFALLLRLLGGNFKMISTRHAETLPSKPTEKLLKKTDTVVALTQSMADDLDYTNAVIGHGIDQGLFIPKNNVLKNGITQTNILTCAGRVREAKGQKLLIEIAAPVLKKYADWALLIIGKVDNPAFLKELKTIVKQNDVEAQVYFIPETPEIISYYQASHSVIVPSFTEGFSLVCAEAMSCGCNVLASRGVGVHSEIIEEGKTGYLFDVHNRSELEKLLEELFSQKLQNCGEAAHNEIANKWSSQIEAQKLMELYELK